MKSLIYTFFLLVLSSLHLDAQNIPIGTWRNHLSYQTGQNIAITPNEVYCSTDNGLFYLDKSTNSLNTLSKIDDLSESIISQIGYYEPLQSLVIAYENSNIDLLTESEIIELPLIKNTTLTGSKSINHIYFQNDIAYLASDFGVVLLDLSQEDIVDTYQNLGTGGTSLAINATTISQDTIFLATEQGVLFAPLSANLLDFNSWTFFDLVDGLPQTNVNKIITMGNFVYALIDNEGLFKYNHNTGLWQNISGISPTIFTNMQVSENQILICVNNQILSLDESDNITTISQDLITNPRDAQSENDGTIWLADAQNGLIRIQDSGFQSFFPNGVARAETWKTHFAQNKIYTLSGGFDDDFNPINRLLGYYEFENGLWTNYNSFDTRNAQSFPNTPDLVDVAFHRQEQSLYFASFGEGILFQTSDNTFETIDETTTDAPFQLDNDGNLQISAVETTSNGDLWVSQHNVPNGTPSLFVRRQETGLWESFTGSNNASANPLDILIDNNDSKWMKLNPDVGGGIWVLNERDNQSRYLNNSVNNGDLPDRTVNSIIQDLDGQIWVGTDNGVVVFFSPFDVFEGTVNAVPPVFDSRPLLRFNKVNSIAVDGGNRKWIGTDANGLWLFSEDGTELIANFNEDNSPLLSNKVLDLEINPQTGEVFITTDKGLISYRSDATNATSQFQNFKVFPNPVPPNYTGLVGISGLAENVNVKITDISGRLIHEAFANGGTLSWDLQDYTGFRAKAGIYLIFASNSDGTETFVGKIAVVD